MLLADDPDEADVGAISPRTVNRLPASFRRTNPVKRIYLSEYSIEQARQMLFDGIIKGTGWINYLGHGGHDCLADEGLLTNDDIENFSNTTRLPIMTAMTCLVGRFEFPGTIRSESGCY